jgi:hypothetical protein
MIKANLKEGRARMDYGKSFSFVFDDEEWVQKILIGGILSLIPIVNLVAIGYGLKVLKNVAAGMEKPLPDWDDFGDYFVKGLVSSLGSLVWALPAIGVSICSTLPGLCSAASQAWAVYRDYMACSWRW